MTSLRSPSSDDTARPALSENVLGPGGKVDPQALYKLYEEAESDEEGPVTVRFRLSRDLKKRLDRYLVDRIPHLSRTSLQRLIREQAVLVNGRIPKTSTRLRQGDEVLVVLLRRVTGRRSIARRAFPHMTGVTLTPERRGELALLGPRLPDSFTPTVFLSLEDVARLPRGVVDTTLAHELGHALGLSHVEAPNDLMSPAPHRCLPRLTEAQARRIADPRGTVDPGERLRP